MDEKDTRREITKQQRAMMAIQRKEGDTDNEAAPAVTPGWDAEIAAIKSFGEDWNDLSRNTRVKRSLFGHMAGHKAGAQGGDSPDKRRQSSAKDDDNG